MMKPRVVLLLLVAVIVAGCGQKSADLQDAAVPPDTALFENGMKYLKKNQYIKARLAFQTLINTYPDSEFTPISFLSIADSYYREGGTSNLLQAEAQYKDFIIFKRYNRWGCSVAFTVFDYYSLVAFCDCDT